MTIVLCNQDFLGGMLFDAIRRPRETMAFDGRIEPGPVVEAAGTEPHRTAFRLYWEDGRVAALGGSGIPHPAPLPLAARSENEFAGYHLAIDMPANVEFMIENGAATGLKISDGRRTLEARRES